MTLCTKNPRELAKLSGFVRTKGRLQFEEDMEDGEWRLPDSPFNLDCTIHLPDAPPDYSTRRRPIDIPSEVQDQHSKIVYFSCHGFTGWKTLQQVKPVNIDTGSYGTHYTVYENNKGAEYFVLSACCSQNFKRSNPWNLVRSELISIDEAEAHCWMEITSGMRVKAVIPATAISPLRVASGDVFFWDVENKRASLPTLEEHDGTERQRLRKSLEALQSKFRDDLRHRKTDLE